MLKSFPSSSGVQAKTNGCDSPTLDLGPHPRHRLLPHGRIEISRRLQDFAPQSVHRADRRTTADCSSLTSLRRHTPSIVSSSSRTQGKKLSHLDKQFEIGEASHRRKMTQRRTKTCHAGEISTTLKAAFLRAPSDRRTRSSPLNEQHHTARKIRPEAHTHTPDRNRDRSEKTPRTTPRQVHRDRDRDYRLRESEVATLIEIAKFRTVRPEDIVRVPSSRGKKRTRINRLAKPQAQGFIEKRTMHGRKPGQLLAVTSDGKNCRAQRARRHT